MGKESEYEHARLSN